MTTPLNVVAVSGSLHNPSKTTVLVEAIAAALGRALPAETHLIRLTELGPLLGGALSRGELPAEAEAELQAIESADVLIVGSPVYRASFTGLFKHLFDFVDQYSLVDTPVFLAATGGSERHALIIEHQFRPLFSFFQALTLPVGVYAHDSDFANYEISSPRLQERLEKAVAKAVPLIQSHVAEREEIARALAGEIPPAEEPDPRRPVRLLS
ncbi:FMN reductase [Galbitalea soli]|uniref:FMN reductase n=1 Tax=Galbitalea soli TaxID=1268042 RepID=A0A7C9TNL0_9MICO|nr:FMN reductase [Galbitalea soli]NEM89781.1 FMN reductase [Galbitalea soli]NYJ30484.1 FMN reductase [Galbitalea soli]